MKRSTPWRDCFDDLQPPGGHNDRRRVEAKDPVNLIDLRQSLEDMALGQLRIEKRIAAKMRCPITRLQSERRKPVETEGNDRYQDKIGLLACPKRWCADLGLRMPLSRDSGRNSGHVYEPFTRKHGSWAWPSGRSFAEIAV